jgi:peptidoglycan/xylan/chitin deacetylase (PgdA/CDA1 family)
MKRRRWYGWVGAIVAVLCAYGLGGRLGAAAARPAPLVTRVPITDKVIALTFDDGPTPKWTPALLKILTADHVPSTFFVIGQQAERYPALVADEVRSGMEIASHGMAHVILRNKPADVVREEVTAAAAAIQAAGAPAPTLYRLPAGVYDSQALMVLGGLHYVVVGWSIDPRDWRHRFTAAQMAHLVETEAEPGAIVIFHDGSNGSQATLDAVKQLIPFLKKEGYRFMTVSAMLKLVKGRI